MCRSPRILAKDDCERHGRECLHLESAVSVKRVSENRDAVKNAENSKAVDRLLTEGSLRKKVEYA